MQKTMFKTICVFTLVFFVMSMTGAAACYGPSCSKTNAKCKTDARNDTFNCKSKSCCYNVLKNDKGCDLKVVKPGCFTTKMGGKVCIQSNGKFCYTKPEKCSKSYIDSFKYCVKGKDGRTDCATVKINVKCCSKCVSICAKCPTCPSCTSCKC